MIRSTPFFLLTASLVVAGPINAQQNSSDVSRASQDLKSRIEQVKGEESIDEVTKTAILKDLNEAVTHLETAAEFEAQTARFKAATENGPREVSRLEAETAALDESRKESLLPANVSGDSSSATIEEALLSTQDSLLEAQEDLSSFLADPDQNRASPAELSDRVITARAEMSAVEALITDLRSEDESVEQSAETSIAESRLSSLKAEISMLNEETQSFDIRQELFAAQRALREMRVAVSSARLTALQSLANERITTEMDRAEALLRRVDKLEIAEDEPFKLLVSELGDLIDETRSVSQQVQITDQTSTERQSALDSIRSDFESVKRQVELGGLEGTFAAVLLERQRSLPSALEERQLLRTIREDLTEAQRRQFLLENSSGQSGKISNSLESSSAQLHRDVESTLERLRNDLISNYRRLIRSLGQLDRTEHQIDQEAQSFRSYLSEQLFWVRSSPWLNVGTFAEIESSLRWAVGPSRVGDLWNQLTSIPFWLYAIWLGLLVPLLTGRGKFVRQLEVMGDRTRRVSSDKYANTLRAFSMTCLLALPVPFSLVAFGTTLRNLPEATEWSFGLGSGLLNLGVILFAVTFTREVAREKGLGVYHFKWRRETIAQFRALLRKTALIYAPVGLLVFLVIAEYNAEHFNSLGRIAALVGVIGIGIQFIRFTKPQSDSGAISVEDSSGGNHEFFRRTWIFWLHALITLGLVFLLVSGFVITAFLLLAELQMSILAILIAFVVHGMALRWFEIRERKMALGEAIAERKARLLAAAEEKIEEEHDSEEMLIIEAEKSQQLDLVEVAEQTRNVIQFLVGALLLTSLYYIWTELAPVLSVLEGINVVGSLSIADFGFTILIIAVIISITKNLAGLLEMLVLRRLDIVPGTRAAMISLAQYAVIAIGALIVFRHVGIDWSQFGWIAAALSVGLGFGLQEVVANFICGIILLFERPIRVGDVVSVSGVEGTVSRIQMRATTITNWDREEFVVPNKEFITGSLLNMTLTNPINRLIFRVGVAYGSDTEEVLRILEDIAQSQPDVMEDPAPIISFEGFGDNSLDFAIRIYLPNRQNRLGVTTEMNHEINRRFEEAGIEIPFPQRDLHVRSVDESILSKTDASEAKSGPRKDPS
ncbi:MAG: mechanosensitive ion channel domain-containing protein [Verrucomicrobiota bacterium]